jgi:hypothetical protein
VEASWARIFQSILKTGRDVMTGGACGIITELRRVEAEDGLVDDMGCIELFYPKIIIFYVLCHRGNLIF